jgi:hypothetical protein
MGEAEKCGNNNSSASWFLDFVRLNIIAQRS